MLDKPLGKRNDSVRAAFCITNPFYEFAQVDILEEARQTLPIATKDRLS
jgi:hypothetical protein